MVADAHKRRTISKADIAKALAKSDHFDFLIDVVPRDEAERAKTQKAINSGILEEENRVCHLLEITSRRIHVNLLASSLVAHVLPYAPLPFP